MSSITYTPISTGDVDEWLLAGNPTPPATKAIAVQVSDTDTGYITSVSAAQQQLFDFSGSLPETALIQTVQLKANLKTLFDGVKLIVKENGITSDASGSFNEATWTDVSGTIMGVRPSDNGSWTLNDISNLQIGVEASSSAPSLQVTFLSVTVEYIDATEPEGEGDQNPGDTLTLTEQLLVTSATVTDTLEIIETLSSNPGNGSSEDTLFLIEAIAWSLPSANDTLDFIETIAVQRILPVTDTLVFTENASNRSLYQHVSDTLTFTEGPGDQTAGQVADTLIFVESVSQDHDVVSDTLEFSEEVAWTRGTFDRAVSDFLDIKEKITFSLSGSASDTLVFTETVAKGNSPSDELVLVETVVGYLTADASDTLVFTEEASVFVNHLASMNDTLIFTEFIATGIDPGGHPW